ncbi:translocator protein [Drosophila subpulchrella]|uniref:translocator protein n=1 Tax=Drosophila subpulchrella TaxID=1486046 RepID=UPI0018A156FC|nr:translocator protein [Drosophila subpulchrella]
MADRPCAGNLLRIAGAVILPNLGGIYNGRLTRQNLQNWYANLKFPSFKPPNAVFAPMWISLYAGMGYGSYLVWRDGGGFSGEAAKLPLIAYGTQLALNWAWTPIFFGQHNIKGALIDIVALTATAGACGVLFYRVNKTAGLLFVPYLAWLGFATALNYAIWKLNPEEKKPLEEEKPSGSAHAKAN